MPVSRRTLLKGIAAPVAAGIAGPALGANIRFDDLRGGFNAADAGLRPGAADDQSRLFQQVLDTASAEDKPVFLPPGRYQISNIVLPPRTRLMGVPGASRLVYTGGGHFLMGENMERAEFDGLVIDGSNLAIESYAGAALRINTAKHVRIENCDLFGSREIGLEIDRSAGQVTHNRISGAAGNAGIFCLENTGLAVTDNQIEDCANCGIMIYRWQRGEDNTIITGNRVRQISALKGGTGPWGNGINTYQCDGVVIADNHVSDCRFSAIRSNSCSNVRITSNTCIRSGETGIYSEFAFQGAMVANNIVDGGARGISIANLDHGGRLSVCSGNLIRNVKATAPYRDENHIFGTGISAEADIAISGNTIERVANFGLMLGWGSYMRNVVATGNVIRNARTGVYVTVVEGTGEAIIANNSLSSMTSGAIVGYRWKEPVTGDLARNGADRFANLTIEGNRLG